jgi:mRNA interferase MazF
MPPTIDYKRGDVVLVRFVFSDETGTKHRPAVIISTTDYHQSHQEAIMAAITSNVDRLLTGDYRIASWKAAGLLFPSTATAIIRTIKQAMIERRLGTMSPPDMQAIEEKLREVLDL